MLCVCLGCVQESMFQLCQLWVARPEEDQYATFLYALFDAITTPDGSLKEIDTEDGSSYRLSSIDDVDSIAREDGTVVIEGVRTLNPFAADDWVDPLVSIFNER